MKKILTCSLLMVFLNINTIIAQLKITNSGNVGIGNNNPTFKLDVQGKVRFGRWGTTSTWEQIILDWNNQWGAPELYCASDCNFNIGKSTNRVNRIYVYGVHANAYWGPSSDERLKENIKKIENPLSKVLQLNAISFNYKSDRNGSKFINNYDRKTTFGYIAQDLIKIFPELVLEPDSTISYYSVNYIGLVPVLAEALKEQHNIITAQSFLIKELDNRLALLEGKKNSKESLKSAFVETDTTVTTLVDIQKNKSTPVATVLDNSNNFANSFLYQNCPNPYSEQTEIKYYISEGVKTSSLYIFDMQGVLKKQITLNTHGFGSVIIKAYELKAGMYIYSLVCDNHEISTKRMILTE